MPEFFLDVVIALGLYLALIAGLVAWLEKGYHDD